MHDSDERGGDLVERRPLGETLHDEVISEARARRRPQVSFAGVPPLLAGCPTCPLRDHCAGARGHAGGAAAGDDLQRVERRVRRGDALFRAGDTFRSIHIVRSGSFKTALVAESGIELVTGFHLGGEAMGLDGAGSGAHTCSAVALEDSQVCAISFAHLEALERVSPTYWGLVARILGLYLDRVEHAMHLLRSLSCDQRTAALMLDFAERYRERGYSGSEFRLRMRRKDIASYIGAKHETVCRAMTRLRTQGLIDIRRDLVRIVDAGRLRAFVETV